MVISWDTMGFPVGSSHLVFLPTPVIPVGPSPVGRCAGCAGDLFLPSASVHWARARALATQLAARLLPWRLPSRLSRRNVVPIGSEVGLSDCQTSFWGRPDQPGVFSWFKNAKLRHPGRRRAAFFTRRIGREKSKLPVK